MTKQNASGEVGRLTKEIEQARKIILAGIKDAGWSEAEFRAEPDHKDMVEWLDRNGGWA